MLPLRRSIVFSAYPGLTPGATFLTRLPALCLVVPAFPVPEKVEFLQLPFAKVTAQKIKRPLAGQCRRRCIVVPALVAVKTVSRIVHE